MLYRDPSHRPQCACAMFERAPKAAARCTNITDYCLSQHKLGDRDTGSGPISQKSTAH